MSSVSNNKSAFYYEYKLKPIEIKKDCKLKYTINKKKGRKFDVGAYGSISEACLKSDCNYVVKLIPLSKPNTENTFRKESLIAPLMGKK